MMPMRLFKTGAFLNRRIFLCLLIAAVAQFAAPASASDPAPPPLTATDSRGRAISLTRTPERVVALRDGAYGQLAALGLRPVGAIAYRETRADTVNYFPDPASIAVLDGPSVIDGEALAALRPDLIIGSGGDLALLQTVAPVFEMGAMRSIAELRRNLTELGALTGRAPQAAAAIARFDRRLAAYRAIAGTPLDVLMVGARDGRQVMIEAGANCELIDAIFRCRQPRAPARQNWIRTSLEGLLASDPDVIILSNWSSRRDADFLTDMAKMPLWAELKAVRSGRVVILEDYRFPDGLSLVKAIRLIDQMVPRLRPDVLSGPLTEAQIAARLVQPQPPS